MKIEKLPLHTQGFITTAAHETFTALENLQSTLVSAGHQSKTRGRLKFAIFYQKVIEKAEKRLEVSKSTLIIALQLLDLHASTVSQASLSNLSTVQENLQHQVKATHAFIKTAVVPPRGETSKKANDHGDDAEDPYFIASDGISDRVEETLTSKLRILSWGSSSVLVSNLGVA